MRLLAPVALALTLIAPAAPATAQQAPFVRGIEGVCPPETRSPDRFPDADGTHREAVNCMAAYGVALGRSGPDGRVFDPGGTVTREQMATFIVRSIEVTGDERPLGESFADVGQVHGENVRKLAGAGIAAGSARRHLRGEAAGHARADGVLHRADAAGTHGRRGPTR